jgi:activator of 2-hydroxyglutaryl-CoA dehydratase
MSAYPHILGVDIGSVSIAVLALNSKQKILGRAYEFHHGNTAQTLKEILNRFELKAVGGIAVTAGTGSFLDQQARRLNLSGAAELSRIACSNTGPVPKIASRCAVFAKRDLVHAQQEAAAWLKSVTDSALAWHATSMIHFLRPTSSWGPSFLRVVSPATGPWSSTCNL